MRIKILLFTALLLAVIFHSSSSHALQRSSTRNSYYAVRFDSFVYKIIQASNNTWGYDILKDNKILIHQPNKPGLPGQEGFKSKRDAEKVARLVIVKLKSGEIPPTVSLEELRTLKVIR